MSDHFIPPYSEEAEQSLLGAIMLRPTIIHDLRAVLDPSDFYKPGHQYLLDTVYALFEDGHPIDALTVADELDTKGFLGNGIEREYLLELMNATPSVSSYGSYADIVIDCSRRRRLIAELAEHVTLAYARGNNIDEILAGVDTITHSRLIAPRAAEIAGLYDVVDFALAAAAEEADAPWLIDHVMKPRWRTILVAPEGIGKAVLMRFLAAHVAAGRDAWYPSDRCEQRRVLYIDVENPAETILHQIRVANRRDGVDLIAEGAGKFHIWHREGGIDIRQRRHAAELESVLQKVQPEIVFAGPMYKLYRRSPREDMEQAALEFTEILDDLRVRYNFGLMLEHHAPKASGGSLRDLNPFGSSLFLRWPEIGLSMDYDGDVRNDDEDYVLKIGRFRRDRVANDWPLAIERKRTFNVAWRPSWGARVRGEKLGL